MHGYGSDTTVHRKVVITHDELVPDFAILVPGFTLSMPPKLTSGTGRDVLAHAMDAVTTPAANEFTDALALQAIHMVFKWLPRAYKNGQDREARHRMLVAASIAGIAFGMSGAHLTHSFGHSLGGVFQIHHGLSVDFFLPPTLQFCSKVTDKHLLICKALNLGVKNAEQGVEALVDRVRGFLKELGVPLTLRGMGISRKDFKAKFDRLVELASGDVACYMSPRPITPAGGISPLTGFWGEATSGG